MQRLPWLYAAVLVLEAVVLAVVFARDAPAPAEPLSVWLGWGALGSMVVMVATYSVARRSRRLRKAVRLSGWLHFHIFLGVQGVLLAFFHCFHLFGRLATTMWTNPGVLAALAVAVVFFSGLFGRYLYSWLPRAVGGEQLALREVEAELGRLEEPLSPEVTALWRGAPPARGFLGLVAANRQRRAAHARLRAMDLPESTRALAARRLDLERKKANLLTAERTFRNWIVLHRPLAAILFVLAAVHVALAYMFTPGLR